MHKTSHLQVPKHSVGTMLDWRVNNENRNRKLPERKTSCFALSNMEQKSDAVNSQRPLIEKEHEKQSISEEYTSKRPSLKVQPFVCSPVTILSSSEEKLCNKLRQTLSKQSSSGKVITQQQQHRRILRRNESQASKSHRPRVRKHGLLGSIGLRNRIGPVQEMRGSARPKISTLSLF